MKHQNEIPTDSTKLHAEAGRRWARLEREHPELAETIAFGRGLVALYIEALPNGGGVPLTVEAAREKLRAGVPLLEGEELDLDPPGLRHFFARLCAWAHEQPELAVTAQRLQRGLDADEVRVDDLLADAMAGEEGALDPVAARLAIDPTILHMMTGFLVSAALMGAARANGPLLVEAAIAWEGPICPICGGSPLLAELQGSGGERMLRCGGCGTGWRTLANRCAHCGNTDEEGLHYLAAEGREEEYRVDLCDRCHGYLKSVTSSAPTPRELLTIEDAAMLHLDAAARERGYTATPEVAV